MNLARSHADFLTQSFAAQQMVSHQPYFANDKYLVQVRSQTKSLCFEYNHCEPSNTKLKGDTLKRLLPHAKGIRIEANFFCDYGVNIKAQSGVFLNHNVTILDGAEICLGENVLIGPNTVLAATKHAKDVDKRRAGECLSRPITIEQDAWLGANVTVLGGVTIGQGAIIGAGVVVKANVEPFSVITAS